MADEGRQISSHKYLEALPIDERQMCDNLSQDFMFTVANLHVRVILYIHSIFLTFVIVFSLHMILAWASACAAKPHICGLTYGFHSRPMQLWPHQKSSDLDHYPQSQIQHTFRQRMQYCQATFNICNFYIQTGHVIILNSLRIKRTMSLIQNTYFKEISLFRLSFREKHNSMSKLDRHKQSDRGNH